MWIIPGTLFAQPPVLPCRFQRRSLGLVTTIVPFAHVEKIVGLSALEGLVQPSCQEVSRALVRHMRLVYNFNDIDVILKLVL